MIRALGAHGAPGDAARATGIAAAIVRWQRDHGRHDLPWQRDRDPYRIWVSEIMLQQTQVATVVGYYDRFLARFPTLAALAAADDDAVLGAWSGLGYYSRARNLHRAARLLATRADGWPTDVDGLAALPGVGESTAAAIATFCFGRREAILDGNVRRVYVRYLGIGDGHAVPRDRAATVRLWAFARAVIADPALSNADAPALIQGLMDLGGAICTRSRPRCQRCPMAAGCEARKRPPVAAPRRMSAAPLAHRRYRLLLIRQGDDTSGDPGPGVWLERRPASGLWGGLWSLPQIGTPHAIENGDDRHDRDDAGTIAATIHAIVAAAGLAATLAAVRAATRPVDTFEHAFTHFRMQALIHRIDLPGPVAPAADRVAPLIYLPLVDRVAIEAAPLAAPIRALLLAQVETLGPGQS